MKEDKSKISLFHFSEEGKFFRRLDLLKSLPNIPFKCALFIYDKRYDILQIFSDLEYGFIKKFEQIDEDEEKKLFYCDYEKKKEDKISNIYFIIYKNKPIALLISNQIREEWKSSLSFFNKFYPFLARIFLRSFQILNVLKFIEENNKLNLIAKSYVAKRYFGNRKSEICYEKISYEKAFNQAISNDLWIDSIVIGIEEKSDYLGSVRLNRKGIFSYRGLLFSDFYKKFIVKVIEFFITSFGTILENKSRSIENLESKPVKLTLSDEVFLRSEDFDNLINKIKNGLKNWGYSILSKNNNFGQIMLHDYSSGASFDLYISSSKEMYIIPQTQVTEISFNRLLTWILDNFEGELENV
ncbi:MAG: hypothetical protein M1416_00035 [Candidatus Pacearchaeota archaeon]|nr:hypothetical protein [Candidatus Pacearchaeota archaeon]